MAVQAYDLIVVGAGTAGATFAACIAARTAREVLLIEAGHVYRAADVPVEIRSIEPNFPADLRAQFEWPRVMAKRTQSQPATSHPVPKVGGGGSSINAMLAMRALGADFDRWGCVGWSGADVLPTLVRIETDPDFGALPYHGVAGPLFMSRTVDRERWSPVDRAFVDAATSSGEPFAEDHNAPGATGVSPLTRSTRGGRRQSTVEAFLEPARSLPNLRVIGDAIVEKVLFEGSRVTGVQVGVGGESSVFHSTDVLISAGAFGSPALLVRSGIGASTDLTRLGVRRLVERRGVGKNLFDHPLLPLRAQLAGEDASWSGRGEVLLRFATSDGESCDGCIFPIAAPGVFLTSLLDPVSRGELLFRSAAPTELPNADLNMLSRDRDRERLRAAVRRCVDLVRHPSMAPYLRRGIALGPETVSDLPDADLDRALLRWATEFAHPCGTCRMGAEDDPDAVVDAEGRVFGVTGLSVLDASIFPSPVRAPPALTCVMLGAHAAEARLRRDR